MRKTWIALMVTLIVLGFASAALAGGVVTPNGGTNNYYTVRTEPKTALRGTSSGAGPTITKVTFEPATPTMRESFKVTLEVSEEDQAKYNFGLILAYNDGNSTLPADLEFAAQEGLTFTVDDTMALTQSGEYYYFVKAYLKGSNSYTVVKQGPFNVQAKQGVQTVEEKVQEIVRANKKSTQYETALALHDWLVNNAYYDKTYIRHSAGHILFYNTGVCDSYSKAYEMLLNAAGIECVRILNARHAWNAMKLDGKWYEVDATWDDPSGSTEVVSGQESHWYFAVPDAYIKPEHVYRAGAYEAGIDYANQCTNYDKIYYILKPDDHDGRGCANYWLSHSNIKESILKKLKTDHNEFKTDALPDNPKIFIADTSYLDGDSYDADIMYDICARYLNRYQGLQYNGKEVLVNLSYNFDTNMISGTSGHDKTVIPEKPATCDEPGTTETIKCSMCEIIFSGGDTIPALGHQYGDPTYTWADDNRTVTANRVCGRNETHTETETVNTTSKVTKDATCTEDGTTTYTATFTNSAFAAQSKNVTTPALGHDWGEATYTWAANNSTATATRVCGRNAAHTETETVDTTSKVTKDATCAEDGTTTYTATFNNSAFETQSKDATIAALGHQYAAPTYAWTTDNSKVTATRICDRNAAHKETETVNTTSEVTKDATCTEDGTTTYTAAFTNPAFAAQSKDVTVLALGHDWNEPTYTWADNYCTVTGQRICKRNADHTERETVITQGTVTKEATYTEKGETTYTATFTNTAFASQTKTVANIPMLDPDWEAPTYQWAADYSSVTATRISRTNSTISETETQTATSSETQAATCDQPGIITHTSNAFVNEAFTVQTATEPIPAKGHAWGAATYTWAEDNATVTATRICANDAKHVETGTANVTFEETKSATCAEMGETTYTSVAFENEAFAVQTRTLANIDKLPHTIVTVDAVPATCTETGLTEGQKCSVCGEILTAQAVIPAKGHVWDEGVVTTEPTTEQEGVRTYTCSVCHETRTEPISKLPPTTAPEAPTPTPSATPTPTPTPTAEPITEPTATPTAEPTVTPAPVPAGNYDVPGGKVTLNADGSATYTGPAKDTATVTIPDSVTVDGTSYPITKIADKAFYKKKKLTTITIGANIEEIGKNAFASCAKLKTVKGGANVKIIGANAFSGDKKLSKFPTMNNLEKIGASAFKSCAALTKFTIGEKVNSIGKSAFQGCKKLKTITIKSPLLTTKNVGSSAFKGINSKATIKCPKKQLKAYKKWLPKKGVPKTAKIK